MSVCCASASAIQTLWRCPPDNSSTQRSASFVIPIISSASSTAAKSSFCRPPKSFRYGKRPLATRSVTLIPSGTTGDCGRSPSVCAICFDGIEKMLFPSKRMLPCSGFSSFANVFNRVDLPHPFAPRITLILFCGIVILTSETIVFPS